MEKDISNILNEVFSAKIGRILKIKQGHSKRDQDKRLWAKIEVFPSGTYENVPFWGGGFDLNSEMPHGSFIIPRENQLILILFLNGSFENPIGIIPFPHPYDDSFVEKYYDLVENINDIGIYHYSGSRCIMREDGSIDIQKRIEESTDNFTNHTLKLEFEYDDQNDIRKKIITDNDNNVIIEINTEGVKITDDAGQIFNMHFKPSEEKIELIDKSGQKITLDSSSGSEKILIEKSGSQKIELNSSGDSITGPKLDLLGASESFVKGDTWKAGFNAFLSTLAGITGGSTAQNATAIQAIATAATTLNALLSNMLSSTIKGE